MNHVLRIHFLIPRIGALHCEIGPGLYKKRLYSINKWNKETILELPLAELIFTPWHVVRAEKQYEDISDISGDGQIGNPDINPDFPGNPQALAKNR